MIFEYAFMRKAFAVGILLAIIVPCIGIIVVLKRLSMIGDALSHSSLAGIAAGLVFNINPILGAIIASLASAFSIEFIRKKLPKYSEMYIAFDEEGARMVGIPVKAVNFIFTILTAFTVSIAARTVGALIVSSMMVVPVACAMKFAKSYKQTVLLSILFAVIFTIIGLSLSYYMGLKPGGTIVLCGVVFLILTLIIKRD